MSVLEPHRDDSPSAEAWGDCGSTRERGIMAQTLVMILIDSEAETEEKVREDVQDYVNERFGQGDCIATFRVDQMLTTEEVNEFGGIDWSDALDTVGDNGEAMSREIKASKG